MEIKAKRERSMNFTIEEREVLVNLVAKHKDVIENKKSDGTTWKRKEEVWNAIENEFNARCGGAPRSVKTLKIKYEGLKRSVRKKSAVLRSELYRTGGGTNTAVPLDATEEKIKSLILLSTDGLESIFDSDVITLPEVNLIQEDSQEAKGTEILPSISMDSVNENSEEKELNIIRNITMENVQDTNETETILQTPALKWDVTSRRNLRTRRHPALVANTQNNVKDLTKAKLELIHLQKKLIEFELAEKIKESAFKEKQQQWMEAEHLLKLEILRKQLNE